ncbi:MAG: helix-turn-helix domain-containing protein [Candidatus Anammoxibacter sp.]
MMLTKSELNEIDCYAGWRVRETMKEAGYSQQSLAAECGVTFQQIQKYLSGANRMGVSRLCQIAAILDKPVFWFLPIEYGGDIAKFGLDFEKAILRYRDKENRMLEILTEK